MFNGLSTGKRFAGITLPLQRAGNKAAELDWVDLGI